MPSYFTPLILLSTALLLAGIGYMIKYQQKLSLLSGYDPSRVRDKVGLASWAGGHILILAIIQGFASLLAIWFLIPAIGLFLVATIGIVIKMVTGTNRFMN